MSIALDASERALVAVGAALRSAAYHFVTPTPATHQRNYGRLSEALDLRDVFGWSRVFERDLLPPGVFGLLQEASALDRLGDRYRSRVRYSTCHDDLFVHSAYPTDSDDSVFFGPDTYRFWALVQREMPSDPGLRVVDLACGTGAGGVAAARVAVPSRLVLADINPAALRFARVNAALAELDVELVESDVLQRVEGALDLVVANAPYLASGPIYRSGGPALGTDLSLRIVREVLPRLAPGGRLVLYTGAPIVGGIDVLRAAVWPHVRGHDARYEELDPDVFGEELDEPRYAEVERIAAVSLVVTKPRS